MSDKKPLVDQVREISTTDGTDAVLAKFLLQLHHRIAELESLANGARVINPIYRGPVRSGDILQESLKPKLP